MSHETKAGLTKKGRISTRRAADLLNELGTRRHKRFFGDADYRECLELSGLLRDLLARDAENREAGMVLVRREDLRCLLESASFTTIGTDAMSESIGAVRRLDAILAATDTEGEGDG